MPVPAADHTDSLILIEAALSLDANAGTFTMDAYDGGLLRVPNFDLPVVVDLQGMQTAPQVKALLHHDPARPAGHMTQVDISQRIRTVGTLSVPEAQSYLKAAQERGFRWESSIGATIPRSSIESIRAGQTVTVNGRSFTGPLYVARQSTLREVSFTGFGAGDNTFALLAASATSNLKDPTMPKPADDAAKNANPDPKAKPAVPVDDAAKESPCGGTVREIVQTELQAALRTAFDPLQSQLDELKRVRITENVEHLAAQYGVTDKTLLDDLKGKAGEGKIGEADIELAILRASASRRAEGFQPLGARQGAPITSAVLEAAYLLTSGWTDKHLADHGDFDEKTINAAADWQGLGPHGLAVEYLRSRGRHVMGGKLQDDDLRAALDLAAHESLQASGGASSFSLPGILSNIAKKQMLMGWNSTVGAITTIARRATTSDYKPFYMYRLNTSGLLQQVGQDGELKSLELAEDAFTSRVYPWGRKLQLTETMFQNDDAGAFNDLARLFGRISMLTLEKQGFTTLLSDLAAFFTTAKGNRLASGAGSALSLDSLKTAYALFLKFTDGTAEANPIGVMPKYLLTGPADAVTARELNTESNIVVATGSDVTVRETAGNPFRGMFTPLMSPYLVANRVPNANNTQWLLCPDPAETSPIVVAYLNGRSTPQIQTWERIPGKLGMQWDISFRFGFNLHEDKAVYSPGA